MSSANRYGTWLALPKMPAKAFMLFGRLPQLKYCWMGASSGRAKPQSQDLKPGLFQKDRAGVMVVALAAKYLRLKYLKAP